jgi:hypothetical protein
MLAKWVHAREKILECGKRQLPGKNKDHSHAATSSAGSLNSHGNASYINLVTTRAKIQRHGQTS